MIKDVLEKNEQVTPNGADLEVLKNHFGMCFNSDGSLDLEKLKARLGDQVAISNEGYELKFLGKNYVRLLTSLETETVVVPDKKHNAKPENAKNKNVYISGDNLDALKHLLKSKQGQVKCIYIDPPYNTGSDGFVYNDSFGFKVEELAGKLSISEDEKNRLNSENGLCLSTTCDAAFDRHLISFDEHYRLIVSKVIKDHYTDAAAKSYFIKREGQKMSFPAKFLPSQMLLEKHRDLLAI